MLLADEFFLIAHTDSRGRARLNPVATGLGLAAALLGELVLSGHISLNAGLVGLVDRRPPADALAHTVLDHIVNEPQHQAVRTWLNFLAQSAAGSVGERMTRNGTVHREESRRLLRTSVVYVPVDINAAAWPATRLRALLDRPEPPTVPDGLLFGLVTATGLTREVLWAAGPRAHHRLSVLIAALPPPLKELVMHTEAAVGAAVLRQ
ncbi:GPP34 family phosphoprotein [Micromonospora sp. CPCC 206060]|uniref:GOLPH3/VPS74 family protein n=1 Tax=Micromonospora sp. CPCC 206060 TaxID=3122406 RepID=UPI002FEE9886